MAVDLDNRRARAVLRKDLNGFVPGVCWTCTHCGYSPGRAYYHTPHEHCINCGFDLYHAPEEGPITEAEALHMQVWHLKWALRSEIKLLRALSIHATTGEMPKGYAPAEQWHAGYAARTEEEIEDYPVFKETWKDLIW